MLPQLFVSEPKGVKRMDSDEVDPDEVAPADWLSVQRDLRQILIARHGLNAPVGSPSWTDKIPFRFAPANKVLATFTLFFQYDGDIEWGEEDDEVEGVPFTKIRLGQSGETCVEASLKIKEREEEPGEVLVVDSLWYTVSDEANRPTCDFLHVGEKGPKGEGAIILGALVNIAAAFGIEKIELNDQAKFHAASAPIWGNIDVTDYLRKVRGYGQYEGLGFFSGTDLNAQQVLNSNNTLMTTPVKTLLGGNVGHAVFQMVQTNAYVKNNKDDTLSMRKIVLDFEEAFKKAKAATPDLAVLDFEKAIAVLDSQSSEARLAKPEIAHLLDHFRAANTIMKYPRFFQGTKFPNTTRFQDYLTKTLTFNGAETWASEVVATAKGPMVQRELLRDEYTFPGVLVGKFADRQSGLSAPPPKTRRTRESTESTFLA
jgi:hypothetical protein